ncbi:MAG: bifunctional tetrahydrofolate synthase/dihydrofolate synthase [Gammaproteobacteria bacterium]|nr:bifunctional tetrahydrofolate synthase/dihydrofolate synthase [Gammaproteobacteria bacterium]
MRFSNLQSWLDWQETLHPNEIELGLERVQKVWNAIHPTKIKLVVITVSGTNGKGSSCAMLESIYSAAGYKVGCYTSPHFIRYNERIHIEAEEVNDADLCEAFEVIDQARGDASLTYFEFGTLAALFLFARASLDVVILEVGLGGRLDAVNIIDPDVALLTSVGLDHQDWLGDTLEEIGLEKAGIFRQGRVAICAESVPPYSVVQHANKIGAEFFLQGKDFKATKMNSTWSWSGPDNRSRYSLPLPSLRGEQQVRNASAIMMVLQSLESRLPVDQNQLRQGLLGVTIPGRFQVVAGDVPVILDVAHNPAAVRILHENLQARDCSGKTYAICGMLKDKDIESVLDIMNSIMTGWVIVPVKAARGAGIDRLTSHIFTLDHGEVNTSDTTHQAIIQVRKKAQPGDQIIIFGSFYVIADALRCLEGEIH